MVIFSTAHEFEELLLHLSAKADTLRLQAKGGSMYPFVQSGDWVTVELCRGTCRVFESDIILFKKTFLVFAPRSEYMP